MKYTLLLAVLLLPFLVWAQELNYPGVSCLMYPVIPEKMRVYAYLFAAPTDAVLGHNPTRSYDAPVYNALLQRQAGRLTFGMPTPNLAVYPSGKH